MKETVPSTSHQFLQPDKDAYNLAKRKKIKHEHNSVDRISELPDEILVSMLSLLSLKEAATTSILSKRWEHMWASTMTLNFNVNFDVGSRLIGLTQELRDQEIHRYIDWVNRVVEQHKGSNIEGFRACFALDSGFKSSIDEWIQFALAKRVQILELEFSIVDSSSYDDFYTFPHQILGLGNSSDNLKGLHSSDSPSLHSFGFNTGVRLLKILHFVRVNVTGETLEYLLSNCPFLGRIAISACNIPGNLRVVGPSIALKHLAITYCLGIQSIEIREAKLVSFTFYGCHINLLLSNVPSLIEVSISENSDPFHTDIDAVRLAFAQLSPVLSQLEFLKLDLNQWDNMNLHMYDINHEYPILSNLKHLDLVVEADFCFVLHQLNAMMKATPYLQRLVLKLYFTYGQREGELDTAAKCPHRYLKVVEIVGYRARKCAVKQVMHLIKNAVALEKIVIDPADYPRRPRPEKKLAKRREHAIEHIKDKVPSPVEFVCL